MTIHAFERWLINNRSHAQKKRGWENIKSFIEENWWKKSWNQPQTIWLNIPPTPNDEPAPDRPIGRLSLNHEFIFQLIPFFHTYDRKVETRPKGCGRVTVSTENSVLCIVPVLASDCLRGIAGFNDVPVWLMVDNFHSDLWWKLGQCIEPSQGHMEIGRQDGWSNELL